MMRFDPVLRGCAVVAALAAFAFGASRAAAAECGGEAWGSAAKANAGTLRTLDWAPFARPEAGWETYAPVLQREIGSACPPETPGFAAALARWQAAHGLPADGLVAEPTLLAIKTELQARRPFLRLAAAGVCPETPDVIAAARAGEGLGGKTVWLRPRALGAWREMIAAARAEVPEIAADPDALAIFSGYRSPSVDAARCRDQGNCDGIVRASCSVHRTGLAMDLYVGHAPGHMADGTADENRRHMSRTAAYRWLTANAHRFGFVGYAFEPWHWEWTGEAP